MIGNREELLRAAYHPLQPGYSRGGKQYLELDYTEDCKLGKYMSEIFEVQCPKSDIINIIPDGCNDILITYNGEEVISWLSPSISAPSKFNFGELKWIFGIRFLPGATYAIFHDNLEYDVQRAIDMKHLFRDFKLVEDAFSKARSFVKRLEVIGEYLEKKIKVRNGIEEILYYCVGQLIDTNGLISIEALSDKTGYGVRYIRELFSKHIGHSPKELANIIRMQKTLMYMWDKPQANLGETAFKYGFADQSHMNREFRKFLGSTSGIVKDDENWITYLKTDNNRIF